PGAAAPAVRQTFRQVHVLEAHLKSARSVHFSPDGALVATAGDREVCLYDGRTGKKLGEASLRGEMARVAYFSGGGHTLVCSAGTRETLYLLDAKALKTRTTIKLPGRGFVSVTVSPDGKLLAVGRKGGVSLFQAITGNPTGQVRVGTEEEVNCVAF